jgi:hypothetical protein
MDSCPRCGREATEGISHNWFPVYTCLSCGEKYCEECGGHTCPECASSDYGEYDKVYA